MTDEWVNPMLALARKEGHRPRLPSIGDKPRNGKRGTGGEMLARVRQLAEAGHTLTEVARIVQRSPGTIDKYRTKHKIDFRKSEPVRGADGKCRGRA